ncbi:MAG: hypothetical protein ISR65_12020 [Bacteriovoracaceae bacterium]|nr:hypothetical protein [Candidatus Brocadiales bacterium]MBL6990502.1 hypothetical protein [Bacteriovoracaceae bacterium]MBL7110295.1 hypothetical protein [Candidatus Neomarinimicrobiota bacterium]
MKSKVVVSIKVVLLLSTMVLVSSCFRVQFVNRCKDDNFCIHPDMPLLSQGSYKLAPIISDLENNSAISRDTGWCSAVSATMALAAEKYAAPKNVRHHHDINRILNIGQYPDIHSRTEAFGPTIHSVGNRIKTNWQRGGTFDSDRKKGFRFYYNNIRLRNFWRQERNKGDVVVSSRLNNKHFVDLFKKSKPGLVTSFYYYDKQRNGSYQIKGGHALTMNGYEDGYIKIYDPWGRVYNVELTTNNASGLRNYPIVKFVSGDSGFVTSYTNSTRKIALKRYSYLYSRGK